MLAKLERIEKLLLAVIAESDADSSSEQPYIQALLGQDTELDSDDIVGAPEVESPLRRADPPALRHAREYADGLRIQHAAMERTSEDRGTMLRLARLEQYAGLDPLDRDLLLLSMLPVLDRGFIQLLGQLDPEYRGGWLTLDMAERLLDPGGDSRWCLRPHLGAGAALIRHGLLRIGGGRPDEPRLAPRLQLQPDSRVVSFLLDDDAPDERLAAHVRISDAARDPGDLFLSAERFAALLAFARTQPISEPGAIIHLRGPAGIGKETLAASIAAQLDRPLLMVGRELRAHARPDLPRIILREAFMQGAVLCWEDLDAWLADRDPAIQHATKCALADARTWLFSSGAKDWTHHCSLGRRPIIEIDLPTPRAEMLANCWRNAVSGRPIEPGVDLVAFTATVRLTPGVIEAAGATAAALSQLSQPGSEHVAERMLLAAARQLQSGGLSTLARRVRSRPGWDELVLPEARKATLRELTDHVRYRHQVMTQWGFEGTMTLGRGISAMFSGPPGTGKTMAAAVVAAELGLDLYRVDLSQLVSKYIGETEKHLGRLFDEAEANSAVLFFDEADALFGKRTEVSDSHDRYANLETSYLLQRIDEYEGLVILATNLSKNMDEAFMRRLRFIVPFALPDRAQRLGIWQRLLPARTPRAGDVDFARLAEGIELSGGYLRNIALSAAYLAAAANEAVGMRHLAAATRREYTKIGRVFEAAELDALFCDAPINALEEKWYAA